MGELPRPGTSHGRPTPPTTAGASVIFGGRSLPLHPGESLTFGRSRGNDLQIGREPLDLGISRNAGVLHCLPDGILVRNLSAKVALTVRTFPGPGFEVAPLTMVGTHPYERARIVLPGSTGNHQIDLDLRALRVTTPAIYDSSSARTTGFARLPDMRPRHRFFLSALCLPLLTASGEAARVPRYTEVREILASRGHHLSVRTIRNNLNDLRVWLTYEHSIPGLICAAGEKPGESATTGRLAEWAIRSTNVTPEDLERLEESHPWSERE